MPDRLPTPWSHRHLLSLADFSAADYDTVLTTAASFQEVLSRRTKKVPALQGRVVTTMFFEASTRTRSSFELAAKRLSADILNFSPGTSSLSKGETILDTAKTYWAMGTEIAVVRHQQAGVPQMIAAEFDRLGSGTSVVNAGDGQHEHPSQALLDLFTLCGHLDPHAPRLDRLAGKTVAIVGDVLHSRVARSNLWSLTAAGARVRLVGPPTLVPADFAHFLPPDIAACDPGLAPTQGLRQRPPVEVFWQLEPALEGADFVMALRLQRERMTAQLLPSVREYRDRYGITRDRLRLCHPEVKILHPGPTNRGVELDSDVMDDRDRSLVADQVASGIAVRMALLYLLGGA